MHVFHFENEEEKTLTSHRSSITVAWLCRKSCAPIFRNLLNVNNVNTSFDGMTIFRPNYRTKDPWWHVDSNGTSGG